MKIGISTPAKVSNLITTFRNLYTFVSGVNIVIDDDKFYIQGMDNSHVCFIEISIKGSWFDEFEGDKNIIGINTETLFKVINNWKEGYNINLSFKNDDKLYITFKGDKLLTKRYQIPTMLFDEDTIKVPDTDYDLDLEMDSVVFKDIISEIADFDNTITFNSILKKINLLADGDMGKVDIEIQEKDILEYAVALEEEDELELDYNIKNILQASNLYKLNESVKIHISESMPIKINYELPGCEESFVRLFIAPKIKDD